MLEPFKEFSQCVECGNINKAPWAIYRTGEWSEESQMDASVVGRHADYILRTCQRCSFKWAEVTLEEEGDV